MNIEPNAASDGTGTGERAAALRWLASALIALGCGDGSAPGSEQDANTPQTAGGDDTAADAGADGPTAADPVAAQRWRSGAAVSGNPGVTGLLTLNEYDWGCCSSAYLGVIQLDLGTGAKRRFLDGGDPSRHTNGTTSFWQFCGTGVNRLALADASGLIRVVTECSSQIPNPGDSPTRFGFSRLSPDGTRIAAEAIYDVSFSGSQSSIRVYDLAGAVLAEFAQRWAPAWAPDGQLLMAGDGLYLASADLSEQRRIDAEQLQGPVNNPCVHPSGERVVFEYNQQLWEMGMDGSALSERVHGGSRLRYPTYSPDGRYIAYLSTFEDDYYERAIYFTDRELEASYSFDLTGIVGGPALQTTVVPNGPLSWTE